MEMTGNKKGIKETGIIVSLYSPISLLLTPVSLYLYSPVSYLLTPVSCLPVFSLLLNYII